jgi:hypothetical protein
MYLSANTLYTHIKHHTSCPSLVVLQKYSYRYWYLFRATPSVPLYPTNPSNQQRQPKTHFRTQHAHAQRKTNIDVSIIYKTEHRNTSKHNTRTHSHTYTLIIISANIYLYL